MKKNDKFYAEVQQSIDMIRTEWVTFQVQIPCQQPCSSGPPGCCSDPIKHHLVLSSPSARQKNPKLSMLSELIRYIDGLSESSQSLSYTKCQFFTSSMGCFNLSNVITISLTPGRAAIRKNQTSIFSIALVGSWVDLEAACPFGTGAKPNFSLCCLSLFLDEVSATYRKKRADEETHFHWKLLHDRVHGFWKSHSENEMSLQCQSVNLLSLQALWFLGPSLASTS